MCELCDGSGVLYVLDWAYAREDGKKITWHENEPYPTWCHGCESGKQKKELLYG